MGGGGGVEGGGGGGGERRDYGKCTRHPATAKKGVSGLSDFVLYSNFTRRSDRVVSRRCRRVRVHWQGLFATRPNWLFQFRVALRPQRPYGLLGTGSPGRPPPLSHSGTVVQNCLLLPSSSFTHVALRPLKPSGILGNDHLDFHTAPELLYRTAFFFFHVDLRPLKSSVAHCECKFSVALRPQKLQNILGTGSPEQPPRLSHRSWAL